MSAEQIVNSLSFIEPAFCLLGVIVIFRAKQLRQFAFLGTYLATRFLSDCALLFILYDRHIDLSSKARYSLYFDVYWGSFLLEALLGFGIILSIYRLAMAPLPGLQRLGMLMFRWAGGIALTLAFTVGFGPKATGHTFLQRAVTQLQQTESVLTLCMLLFVCLAIRPMGLSYRSKIFGVSFGLGIVAVTDLVSAAWISQMTALGSLFNIICGGAILCTTIIWIGYFAIPEPKRRMIVLPTTSPFLRWNQISLALGDEPGFVAVGEISPDMFAPAEVEIMRRASLKMRRIAN